MFTSLKKKIRSVIRQEVRNGIRESLSGTPEKKQLSKLVRQESANGTADAWKSKEAENLRKDFLTHVQTSNQIPQKTGSAATSLEAEEKYLRRRFQLAMEEDDPEAVLRVVKQLAKKKKEASSKYLDLADDFRTAILRKKEDARYKECLKALFMAHNVDEFRGRQFSDVYRLRFPILQANSLRLNYVRRRRMKQIGQVPDRYLSYNKRAGEEFAQMVGMKTATIQYDVKLDNISRQAGICIKPNSGCGSKGVFIVNSLDDVWSVEQHGTIGGWDSMMAELHGFLASGRIQTDSFDVQRAIYSDNEKKQPVHDLKFYSFYGEIVSVAEIVRIPGKYTWWFTEQGKLIHKDADIPDNIKPLGITEEMFDTARILSLSIPSPFVRLDFLRSADDIFFCEFCTFAGDTGATMLEWVDPKWDRTYGNHYLKAEMRIINDLLEGKTFPEICEFNKKYDAIVAAKKASAEKSIVQNT